MFGNALFFNIRFLSRLLKSQFGSSFWCSSYIFGLQRHFSVLNCYSVFMQVFFVIVYKSIPPQPCHREAMGSRFI